jgi:cell division protein FtsI (penicillin-binding protein 3)
VAPRPLVLGAAAPGRRLGAMLVAIVVALGIIAVKVVDTAAVGGEHYDTLARDQLVYATELEPARGSILDRAGNELALSLPRTTVFADSKLIPHPRALARGLAPVLDRSATELLPLLTDPDSRFVFVARQLPPGVVRRIQEVARATGNAGLGFIDDPKRFYPNGALAGPILGTVDAERRGVGGLESKYDTLLRGRPGRLEAERDPNGRQIPAAERDVVPAVAGSDLVLTVDQSLQYQVEEQLAAEVTAARAEGGMAAIADVRTGDLLAVAQVDGAAGSRPAGPSPASARSRVFTDPFEPGSTNKVIAIGSALDAGIIGLDDHLSVPMQITVGDKQFVDDETHGTMWWSPREIVAKSSNVGTITIAGALGRARLDRAMRQFGFGARTAVRFPGESSGLLPDSTTVDPTIMGSLPIGYGAAVTVMQTLGVYATIANGGTSRPLRLVEAVIDADGTRRERPGATGRRIVSPGTAAALNELLRGVVREGTGRKAAIPGYTVAGKTGTARKNYEPPYRYMASFAGFAPAESPRLVGVVVLDEPQGEVHGGAVAAPVFSSVMGRALRLLHVPAAPPDGAAAAPTGNVAASAP